MLYMSSRRTICDGEVVTFATEFKEHDGPFGGHDAAGPFEVSASREGVMVHRAFAAMPNNRNCSCRLWGRPSALDGGEETKCT